MNLNKVAPCIILKPNILMRWKCLDNQPVVWLVIPYLGLNRLYPVGHKIWPIKTISSCPQKTKYASNIINNIPSAIKNCKLLPELAIFKRASELCRISDYIQHSNSKSPLKILARSQNMNPKTIVVRPTMNFKTLLSAHLVYNSIYTFQINPIDESLLFLALQGICEKDWNMWESQHKWYEQYHVGHAWIGLGTHAWIWLIISM